MEAKILIVDDERSLVHTLQQILSLCIPDVCVDAAYSGEEALSLLASSAYHLIIADLRMPGFSGLDLVKGVRYVDPKVPIVLMTAYGSEALQQEALGMGVNTYFDKPFDIDQLLEAVRDCLAAQEEVVG